ncbi:DUF6344 domain-containing protein [Actinacidiphila acidipaludis]|uniref:DUF6344 domain-containing protein n=1 Tax=Actinacidiphila acidipaludis TaxID=2873382 RepID=A0ABS7Q7P5_9ACTN|nr:DUF6344 domain-containing protein [Streptomyces acidipaludis]MBY8879173.1 DUF6344 domain-containing protein [Streptomyces acidipaludis]
MAATANIRTFWGALLSVLLKCVAALGFTTAATRSQTAAQSAEFTGTECGALAAAVPPAREAGSPGGSPSGGRREPYRVPAPRAYEPLLLDRGRTLPPTMKQRISAEAHGSTPRSRTLPAGTLLVDDGCGGLMTVPEHTVTEKPAAHAKRPAQPVAAARRKLAALRG